MDRLTIETAIIAERAIDDLTQLARQETIQCLARDDIPGLLWHFSRFRDAFQAIQKRFNALKAEVDAVSQSDIPTIFSKDHVKTVNIEGLGRCTVSTKWHASILEGLKPAAFEYLRANEAEGLIIEMVPALTLTAHARLQALAGKPLPDDIFTVYTSQFTSITKG